MKRYNLSDEAKEDLVEIRAYLTEEGVASVYSYMIICRPFPRPIGVVRVVHGSRDMSRLFPPGEDEPT